MAKARAITKRRKAVTNIRKITSTMQLIATARFQKCLARAAASKPYTQKLTEMISAVAGAGSAEHPLLVPNASKTAVLLVITSNRGLCGGYNSQVLRAAMEHRKQLIAEGFAPEIEIVGKKGIGFLRFLKIATTQAITDVEDRIAYERVAHMADGYMQRYASGQVGRVDVAYTRFNSLSSQKATIVQLLPIEPPSAENKSTKRREFEFSPPPEQLLARLIPETVKIRLYQYFNDSIVSEQVARMIAMKQATDSAGEMIKNLTREYNRARQSQITMELLDIVGGANAIS